MTTAKGDESNPDPFAFSIPGTGRLLGGQCNVTVYGLINSKKLRSFKVGRRRFVGSQAIRDFIAAAERDTQAAE